MMTGQARYYLGNLWKICNIIGSKTKNIRSLQKLFIKVLTTNQVLPNILRVWTNDVTNVLKVTRIISPLTSHLRFSIFVLETLKFQWQVLTTCQYLQLNRACDLDVRDRASSK